MLSVTGFMKKGLIIRLATRRSNHKLDVIGDVDRHAKGAWILSPSRFAVYRDVSLRVDLDSESRHCLSVYLKHLLLRKSIVKAGQMQEVHTVGANRFIDFQPDIPPQNLIKPGGIYRLGG